MSKFLIDAGRAGATIKAALTALYAEGRFLGGFHWSGPHGVYDDTSGTIGGDDAVRFDGWIAPGRHLVTVRLELTGKDDDRFTTATESTFVVQAVAGKDLEVAVRAADDGDIAYGWKRGERGGYRLNLDVDVKTTARPGADAKPAGKPAKTSAAPAAAPARRTAEAARAR